MATKRSKWALFINTTPKTETATYALIGIGVTELSKSFNPQTNTEQYINQDSSTTNITGYQPSYAVTAQHDTENEALQYMDSVRRKLPTYDDAVTDLVEVEMWGSDESGKYPAIQQKVAQQVDTFGGAAADPLGLDFTFSAQGDQVSGKFDPKTRTFTADSAAAPANAPMSNPVYDTDVEV